MYIYILYKFIYVLGKRGKNSEGMEGGQVLIINFMTETFVYFIYLSIKLDSEK